jgi:hypothetical protein
MKVFTLTVIELCSKRLKFAAMRVGFLIRAEVVTMEQFNLIP